MVSCGSPKPTDLAGVTGEFGGPRGWSKFSRGSSSNDGFAADERRFFIGLSFCFKSSLERALEQREIGILTGGSDLEETGVSISRDILTIERLLIAMWL